VSTPKGMISTLTPWNKGGDRKGPAKKDQDSQQDKLKYGGGKGKRINQSTMKSRHLLKKERGGNCGAGDLETKGEGP